MMATGGMAGEMQAANRNALTAKGFELEARRMAGLMKDKFNIGFIDVGGWDTHVNQGSAQGQLATLLTSLGQGLAGFAEQMGPAWNHTVVFVLSEFGRTFRENGTHGTDHGHGSVHWVLGGAVQGGRFAGEQVAVTPKSLNQNRDFPVLTEYRAHARRHLQAHVFARHRARRARVPEHGAAGWNLNTTARRGGGYSEARELFSTALTRGPPLP